MDKSVMGLLSDGRAGNGSRMLLRDLLAAASAGRRGRFEAIVAVSGIFGCVVVDAIAIVVQMRNRK